MTEHTFHPGDRAYHVIYRDIVHVGGPMERAYGTHPDFLLPPWHPDVPERCRELKPKTKRKVEMVRWAVVFPQDDSSLTYASEGAAYQEANRHSQHVCQVVELRGSYEVDE